MTRRWSALFLVVLLATLVPATSVAADPVVDWTRQFGTSGDDHAWGVAIARNGRSPLVAGEAWDTLAGHAGTGGTNAFVRRYRPDGTVAWTRQFGTPLIVHDIAVGGRGRIAVGGLTGGTLPGEVGRGKSDAFVRVYRADGRVVWTRQFGTSGFDYADGVAVDGKGRLYVAGRTDGRFAGQTGRGSWDAFVRTYRPDGTVAWTRQFGSRSEDWAGGVAVDARGRVAVAGHTLGTLHGRAGKGGGDAFVRVYRRDGHVAWTRQFGTRDPDGAKAIAVDARGRVYVAGYTYGSFPGGASEGKSDAFVRVYRPDGRVALTRQFGTSADDSIYGIAVDGSGRVYVAGETSGTFTGQTSEGGWDAFVRSYGPDGNAFWTVQFGTSESDQVNDIAVDGDGRVVVAGDTDGTFPAHTGKGEVDAFVRVYVQP